MEARLDGKVEQEAHVWLRVARCNSLDIDEFIKRHATAAALVGQCRIYEPVAQYNLTALECRPDDVADVLSACGCVQQSLCFRSHRNDDVAEQKVANPFTYRRAPGSRVWHNGKAVATKRLGEQAHLCTLCPRLPVLQMSGTARPQVYWIP